MDYRAAATQSLKQPKGAATHAKSPVGNSGGSSQPASVDAKPITTGTNGPSVPTSAATAVRGWANRGGPTAKNQPGSKPTGPAAPTMAARLAQSTANKSPQPTTAAIVKGGAVATGRTSGVAPTQPATANEKAGDATKTALPAKPTSVTGTPGPGGKKPVTTAISYSAVAAPKPIPNPPGLVKPEAKVPVKPILVATDRTTSGTTGKPQRPPPIEQGTPKQPLSLPKCVGLHVSITTTELTTYQGVIYVYDPTMGCLVLVSEISTADRQRVVGTDGAGQSPRTTRNYPPPTFQRNLVKNNQGKRFDIIKVNHIKTIQITKASETSESIHTPVSELLASTSPQCVHMEKVEQRYLQSMREAESAVAKIGVGVTQEAQYIFDALSKTLPCRWADNAIVVLDEIIIHSPYQPENCLANNPDSTSLARVKKILQGERQRLTQVQSRA
ncbi:hypothetical protein IWQ61_000015 [Dispira simplex]|nr:hypothetical protein IWQ61_000015 [Dispira simplex]